MQRLITIYWVCQVCKYCVAGQLDQARITIMNQPCRKFKTLPAVIFFLTNSVTLIIHTQKKKSAELIIKSSIINVIQEVPLGTHSR